MSVWTIEWDNGVVKMIDQRYLPLKEITNEYTELEGVAQAIETMVIRGAPAIGVAAAMGLALSARSLDGSKDINQFKQDFLKSCERMAATRPTAVNLFWAIERMKKLVDDNSGKSPGELAELCAGLACKMHDEDIEINKKMGRNGARYIDDGDTVLTHCNAGALATAGYGTALGVIRAAHEQGKKIHVLADETRPFLQGARLTAWELQKDGIPVTVICDNQAGNLMKQGRIQKVVTGADRVAANGDAANKIGTYSVAVLARHHNIPFFVAAPLSTIDRECESGDKIPIEERDPKEVTHVFSEQITPPGVPVINYAFDVTPAELIQAVVTEAGAAEPPNVNTIAALFK